MGVFDRQVVQVEGALDLLEQRLVRLVEAEPDEERRIGEGGRDLVDGERRDAHAGAIGGAVDDPPSAPPHSPPDFAPAAACRARSCFERMLVPGSTSTDLR